MPAADDEAFGSLRLRLRAELARQARLGLMYPAYLGSAMTGAGIDGLIGGIAELLPAAEGDAASPVSGTVFKVDRGPAGEKVAYARLFSGTLRLRDRLTAGRESAARVTAISVFDRGGALPARLRHRRGRSRSCGAFAISGSATRSACRRRARRASTSRRR